MHGTLQNQIEAESDDDRTIVQLGEHLDERMFGNFLGDLARFLWPRKTSEHLAAKAKCCVRAADFYLSGKPPPNGRDWSADAMAAIVSEILERHSMRNIKVQAKCRKPDTTLTRKSARSSSA